MKKLIIAGSRHFDFSYCLIADLMRPFGLYSEMASDDNLEIVTGGAKGVDSIAKTMAKEIPHYIHKEFKADWNKHGKAAGPIRNRQMAEYGDALLLIWDGKSRGSASMKKEMEKLGKPVYEVILKGHG